MADQEIGDRADEASELAAHRSRIFGRAGLSLRLSDLLLRFRSWLAATFEREVERGRASLWVPVLFGVGILGYFALPREPAAIALVAVSSALAAAIAARHRLALFRVLFALTVILAGTT